MVRLPRALLPHTITVEPYQGPTPWTSYGTAETVRCLVDEKITTRLTDAGREVTAECTIYAPVDTVCPTGSRIVLHDGRIGYAAAVAKHDGGALAVPDHLEIAFVTASAVAPPGGETVTLLRRTISGTDAYGNDRYTTVEVAIAGCAVTFVSSSEQPGAVADSIAVVMPPGTDVRPVDRLRVRGLVYQVDGQPITERNPMTGVEAGVRVNASRIH